MSSIPCPINELDSLFESVFHTGYLNTCRFLHSRGASRDIAEEIAQAAWTRGWEQRGQLRCPDLLGAWINSIAMNLWRSQINGSRRFDDMNDDICIHPKVDDAIDAATILRNCRSEESQILRRYYYDGLSVEEIAARNQCPPVTIRVRLMRLRRTLRTRLGIGEVPPAYSCGSRVAAAAR